MVARSTGLPIIHCCTLHSHLSIISNAPAINDTTTLLVIALFCVNKVDDTYTHLHIPFEVT